MEDQGGLEIISIGTLHNGSWDKKYWSSSRGKDRYPYPVGYQALRTEDGMTYRLEIQQGVKGPLFLINSSDGHSFSGQTPEIVWDGFKKKRMSHQQGAFRGKRYSRKGDGVQFFGFRSPFVQRTLRELVANVNPPDPSCLSHNVRDMLFKQKDDEPRNSQSPLSPPSTCLPVHVADDDLFQSLPKLGTARRSRSYRNKGQKTETSIEPMNAGVPEIRDQHADSCPTNPVAKESPASKERASLVADDDDDSCMSDATEGSFFYSSSKKDNVELAKSMMSFLLPQALPLLEGSPGEARDVDPPYRATTRGLCTGDATPLMKRNDETLVLPSPPRVVPDSFESDDFIIPTSANHPRHNQVQGSPSNRNSQMMRVVQEGMSGGGEEVACLVGCYVHPMRVSHVVVRSTGNEIRVCVLCCGGDPDERERRLFLYTLSPLGHPSLAGHAPVFIPREGEGHFLQFTPKGNCLAMITSTTAEAEARGGNSVIIAQVMSGYFSPVAELLTTLDTITCLLVSGQDYLSASEEGLLHVWLMNETWSAPTKEFVMSTGGGGIVELRGLSGGCDSIVVGRNRVGEFFLWDICNRFLVSKFTTTALSVADIIPIGLFSLETNASITIPPPFGGDGDHTALCLLVSSTASSGGASQPQLRQWRIALLTHKHGLVFGTPLPGRTDTASVLSRYGIVGQHDGLVYLWELSTGHRLQILHRFKGHGASCVAVDGSSLNVVAVAGGHQLVVFLLPTPASMF